MARVAIHQVKVDGLMLRALPPFLMRLGLRTQNEASIRCNVDTGLLRSSIHTVQLGDTVFIGSVVNYALYVHEGTRPHEIRASPGPGRRTAWRYLAFKGRDGRMVFRRRVWHPGYGGNPFLRDAMEHVVRALA